MYKAASVFVGLLATTAISLAANMAGSFKWVSGTLTSNLTVTPGAVTVVLKVGTTSTTFTGTYVSGVPGTVLPSGTAMTLLEKGSVPFAANFSTLDITGISPYGDALTSRRYIPITATGVMNDNFAYPTTGLNMELLIPACTITSGPSFPNGLTFTTLSGLAGYTLAMPTGTAATFSTVTFPVTSITPYDVTFTGYGNGLMSFRGTGMASSVRVAGLNEFGAPTEITSASLSFTSRALAL